MIGSDALMWFGWLERFDVWHWTGSIGFAWVSLYLIACGYAVGGFDLIHSSVSRHWIRLHLTSLCFQVASLIHLLYWFWTVLLIQQYIILFSVNSNCLQWVRNGIRNEDKDNMCKRKSNTTIAMCMYFCSTHKQN